MGGDQLEHLINEYISRNIGFIVFVVILLIISLGAIVFGIVKTSIAKSKDKKEIVKGGTSNEQN